MIPGRIINYSDIYAYMYPGHADLLIVKRMLERDDYFSVTCGNDCEINAKDVRKIL